MTRHQVNGRERTQPLWLRATSLASVLLLFVFTLAQAAHTHGALPGSKGPHHLTAATGTDGGAPDQCPLCAGGTTFSMPEQPALVLGVALRFTPLPRTAERRVETRALPFALSSRPPPMFLPCLNDGMSLFQAAFHGFADAT